MRTQTKKHTHARPLAALLLGAGLLLSGGAAAATAAAGGGFELAAVADRGQGALVLDGRYERAIAMMRVQAARLDGQARPNAFAYAASTNLCVAHAMQGRLERAQGYCDASVEAAAHAARVERHGRDNAAEWAAALSNRGVVRALAGDLAGARADLRRASDLAEGSGLPARNLARLERGATGFGRG